MRASIALVVDPSHERSSEVRRLAARVGLVALLSLSAPNCEYFTPPLTPRFDAGAGSCSDNDTDPAQVISFRRDILEGIILRRLNSDAGLPQGPGCGCHLPTSSDPIGITLVGLDLSNYQSLTRGGARSGGAIVIAGRPCESVLYQKVTIAPPFGLRMPRNGPPFLSEQDLQRIHDWIAEGALDN